MLLRTNGLSHMSLRRVGAFRTTTTNHRYISTGPGSATWRPASALDEWVEREARPISLRQLTVFGRTLTEERLISSANYVRNELPTRIAHRLRDMQTLPFVVITNPNMSHVYELYYSAFDQLRRIRPVETIEDNDRLCEMIQSTLKEHLSVIPKLVSGILQTLHTLPSDKMDHFVQTMLRSRISRRVIAEQHLALTETFHEPWHFPDAKDPSAADAEFIGEVFLRCNAKEVVKRCAAAVLALSPLPDDEKPEIRVQGHLDATLTYIPSHLEYIVGELLRNSMQAVMDRRHRWAGQRPPPIDVLICEAPQHVIFRISDQGGGVTSDVRPHLWSFVRGPRKEQRLANLDNVPELSATLQELQTPAEGGALSTDGKAKHSSSLDTLRGRPPDLRLGIGLPMAKVYAEYWAGSLALHNLDGFGVDVFLQISKLGNKNEQLSTRAAMDAL